MNNKGSLEKRLYTAEEVEKISKERVNDYRRFMSNYDHPARVELLKVMDNMIDANINLETIIDVFKGFRRRRITENTVRERWENRERDELPKNSANLINVDMGLLIELANTPLNIIKMTESGVRESTIIMANLFTLGVSLKEISVLYPDYEIIEEQLKVVSSVQKANGHSIINKVLECFALGLSEAQISSVLALSNEQIDKIIVLVANDD